MILVGAEIAIITALQDRLGGLASDHDPGHRSLKVNLFQKRQTPPCRIRAASQTCWRCACLHIEVDVAGIGFMGGFDHSASGPGNPGAPRLKVIGSR
jgi:hypothetical protein